MVKQIEIKGKKISVPEMLRGKAKENEGPNVDGKEDKKAKRELRKKSRQAGKDDNDQLKEEKSEASPL